MFSFLVLSSIILAHSLPWPFPKSLGGQEWWARTWISSGEHLCLWKEAWGPSSMEPLCMLRRVPPVIVLLGGWPLRTSRKVCVSLCALRGEPRDALELWARTWQCLLCRKIQTWWDEDDECQGLLHWGDRSQWPSQPWLEQMPCATSIPSCMASLGVRDLSVKSLFPVT